MKYRRRPGWRFALMAAVSILLVLFGVSVWFAPEAGGVSRSEARKNPKIAYGASLSVFGSPKLTDLLYSSRGPRVKSRIRSFAHAYQFNNGNPPHDMSDAEMHLLMAFPELEELNLSTAPITDDGLAKIKELQNVKLLSIRGSRVTDAGLTNIAGFSQLEELYLQGSKVSGEGLGALRDLKNLRKLRLDDLPIQDEHLKNLAHLVNLESLDISQTEVTGSGLRHLVGLKRLEKLSLISSDHFKGAGLQDLIPLFSTVTPQGKRRELILGWTKLDDQSLDVLKQFTGLSVLNVKSTRLSTNALFELKRALSGTDVQHY